MLDSKNSSKYTNGEIETNSKGHHIHTHAYHRHADHDPLWVYAIFIALAYISWLTYPDSMNVGEVRERVVPLMMMDD